MSAESQKTPTSKKLVNRTMKRTQAANHLSIYANNAQMQVSLYDVKIAFGQVTEVEEKHVAFEDQVTVILSPQHAKVLAGLLVQNVAQYEKQFGEIKIPNEISNLQITAE